MIEQDRLKNELEYTNKLNWLLSKQSDALAETLRFYSSCWSAEDYDGGKKARKTLEEWYDL